MEGLRNVLWRPSAARSPLLASHGVAHGFLGRAGGAPDDRHHARQVHGTRVVDAGTGTDASADAARVDADGVLTRTRGVAVAVKTADCLPVLVFDPTTRAAAAVHAGWRGLTAGILEEAITLLGPASRLVAAVGPAISRERYQVSWDVPEAWLNSPANRAAPKLAALAIAKGAGDKWHFDLTAGAAVALVAAGLGPERIEIMQACTYGEPETWFSYRREGKGCGSNWAWIRP